MSARDEAWQRMTDHAPTTASDANSVLDRFAADEHAAAYREAADKQRRMAGVARLGGEEELAKAFETAADVISPPAKPRRNGMDPRLILGIAPDWPATDADVISKEQQ